MSIAFALKMSSGDTGHAVLLGIDGWLLKSFSLAHQSNGPLIRNNECKTRGSVLGLKPCESGLRWLRKERKGKSMGKRLVLLAILSFLLEIVAQSELNVLFFAVLSEKKSNILD